jgi:GWxTD domain-containing protein
MKSKVSIVIICALLLTSFSFSQKKMRVKDLHEKYQEFLKLTLYIMHEKEKDAFLQLKNDRERDAFIEMFWRLRDPTPGTPENEYKDMHIERFLYANKYFRRGSPREGWMTDMGKFYIILGEPVSKDRYPAQKEMYPIEVWSYYGDKEKGLPSHFNLVFFQRGGAGEYKLYDPVSDGPAALMIHGKGFAIEDYEAMYERLLEIAPTLATVSLSLIPGEIPYGYRPSPMNAILIANIIESPKKDINPTYATHFLNLRGIVSTEHMTNIVDSETSTALIPDPIIGMNFLHFSMVPKAISIDYFEQNDQYFCNFTLNVSLRIENDVIFQYTKEFPLYFSPDDLDKVRANGISIEDSFPVVEGRYRLTILLQNSIGKEFSIFEQDISVPQGSEELKIAGPFLGYKFQDYQSSVHIPYKMVDKKLIIDPKNTFATGDEIAFVVGLVNLPQEIWNEGELRVLIEGLRKENSTQKLLTLRLRDYPRANVMYIPQSIRASELPPDYYEMKAMIVGKDEETIEEAKTEFIISPEEAIAHPIARAKIIPLSNSFLFYYMHAHQYAKLGDLVKAEAAYEKAYDLRPGFKKGVIEYANFLYRARKYEKSLDLIESIRDDDQMRFDYFLIKGRALMGMEWYEEAVDNLIEGNKIYNSDTGLLNSLGFCYYKTGEKERALEILRASLNLNPDQENVKALIEEIEKSKDEEIPKINPQINCR